MKQRHETIMFIDSTTCLYLHAKEPFKNILIIDSTTTAIDQRVCAYVNISKTQNDNIYRFDNLGLFTCIMKLKMSGSVHIVLLSIG